MENLFYKVYYNLKAIRSYFKRKYIYLYYTKFNNKSDKTEYKLFTYNRFYKQLYCF